MRIKTVQLEEGQKPFYLMKDVVLFTDNDYVIESSFPIIEDGQQDKFGNIIRIEGCESYTGGKKEGIRKYYEEIFTHEERQNHLLTSGISISSNIITPNKVIESKYHNIQYPGCIIFSTIIILSIVILGCLMIYVVTK